MKINGKLVLKIILFIVLFFLILFIVGVVCIVHILFPPPLKDIKNYNKCFQSIKYPEDIQHFPKEISSNRKNAKFYCYPGDVMGYGELILLSLKVDKDYVQQELKKHKFFNANTPIGAKQQIYHMPSDFVGINNQDLTYYVLKNDTNYKEGEEYFPYFTGIGISKDMNTILYYYIRPD